MAQPRIIIINDEDGRQLGAQVQAILQRESRYRVERATATLPKMREVLVNLSDLIIPVLPASKERAEQLVAKLRAETADAPLLPVVSSEGLNQMLDKLLLWTSDFLVTPLQGTEVFARVRRILTGSRAQEREKVKERLTEEFRLEQLLGEDPAFVAVKGKLLQVARSEATVLLTGETGTGKERCARAIHYLSRRSEKLFLPVNCGAIPVELFENELFGHQQGAFTGASAAQAGLIAEVEGGTLFLDEIEALSLGAQVKLLRFLQDQTYHTLGSPRPRQADVRIIAATNVELTRNLQEGTFRKDLFYRLAVINLTLPPLRERRADLPVLVAHFLARYADQQGEEKRRLSPRAMEAFRSYAWPGNIRELQNVIQRAVVLAEAQTIEPEDLTIPPSPPSIESRGDSFRQAKARVIEQFEKAYIRELLSVHQGNVTHAAQEAKMERRAFGRLIKKHQLAKR